jgi:adenine-specific DNA-methyltransferase
MRRRGNILQNIEIINIQALIWEIIQLANFFDTLENVLRADERFFSKDNELMRNKVYEAAMMMDPGLLSLLLNNEETKKRFFADVNGMLVFDKIAFGWVVNNRSFLPDSYTRFKNKVGLMDSRGELISSNNDIVLSFPHKDCVLVGGQTKEDQKRDEVFYNESLAPDEVDRLLYPKVLAKAKRYSANGVEEGIKWSKDDNLLIKGNNLLALASLVKTHAGMVKLIYIDPPYFFKNKTATDAFKYNSNFHLSSWLVFMKNRLTMAKKLLVEGGTIWLSISEDGMHYLKTMADDIFGVDHFVGTIPRRTRDGKSDVPFNLSQDFDWLLVYTNVDDTHKVVGRQVEREYYTSDDYPNRPWRLADATSQQPASKRPNCYFTMVNPKNGEEFPADEKRTWAVAKDTFQSYYDAGAIVFPGDYPFLKITKPYIRKFKDEDDKKVEAGNLGAVISDFAIKGFLAQILGNCKNKDGNAEIDDLFSRDQFDYAKPENLPKSIIEVTTEEGDIVLDFFLGSGTTAAVAHKMKRRYIGIEQMDYIEALCVKRLSKVIEGEAGGISTQVNWQGGGSFVYCELAQCNQRFVDEVQSAVTDNEVQSVLERVLATGYINALVMPGDIQRNMEEFKALELADKKKFIMELLDKNMLYVNLCDLDDEDYAISEADKSFNRSFYGLEEQ